jgi:hypothetical protein
VATKPCSNCGHEINAAAVGCPSCGAKWTEAGEYLGVPAAYAGDAGPGSATTRVADMTRDELHTTVFWAAFFAVLAAGFVWAVVGLLLGLIANSD